MMNKDHLSQLLEKWISDCDAYRVEARRLEQIRYATSIAVLEASAQVLERCALEVKIRLSTTC